MVKLIEHSSHLYKERTYHNVVQSDATLAIGIDFATLGEFCTKAATKRYEKPYMAMPLRSETGINSISQVINFCIVNDVHILNIAGNGIYTFRKNEPKTWSQERLNREIYQILIRVLFESNQPIKVVTGGQTGVDWAAAVSCLALGVDCTITFPKGFKQRNAFNIDFSSTRKELRELLNKHAKLLYHGHQ